MNSIPPHDLWIGHAGDGRNVPSIREADIRCVVQLAWEEPPLTLPRDVIYLRIPLQDGSENEPPLLALAVTTVAELLRRRVRTLVCCSAGMSRSPAVVACATAITQDRSAIDCLEKIGHYCALDVSPALWQSLLAAAEQSGSKP